MLNQKNLYGSVEPVTVRFPTPKVSKDPFNQTYDWVSIDGCEARISLPGHPALPVKTLMFKLNRGLTVLGVEVKVSSAPLAGSFKIAPALMPRIVGSSDKGGLTTPDPAIYSSNKSYPGKWSEYRIGMGIDPISYQIICYVIVTLYPVQYTPASNNLTVCREAVVNIKYSGTVAEPLAPSYDLVIITSDALTLYANELATYRASQGINSIVFSTSYIYGNYPGVDYPEKIRNFIISAKANYAFPFLLIFGDADQVPVRQAYINDGQEDGLVETDLYYADLQFSWDDNGDGKWGDISHDRVDGFPDLFVGRLPASTTSEASILVNKIKQYEQNTVPSSSWFKRFLLLGTDPFKDYTGAEGEILKDYIGNNYLPAGFSTTKLYETRGDLTVSNAVAQINNGYGFVNFAGHGSPSSWSFEGAGSYTSTHASGQTNGLMLPIISTMACSTSRFHDTDGIGEKFLLNPNGGAIAYFGATRIAWAYASSGITNGLAGEMDWRFFWVYHHGYNKLGLVWAGAVIEYIYTHGLSYILDWKTVAEYSSPFGDPTLNIGGGAPSTTVRTTISTTETSFRTSTTTTSTTAYRTTTAFTYRTQWTASPTSYRTITTFISGSSTTYTATTAYTLSSTSTTTTGMTTSLKTGGSWKITPFEYLEVGTNFVEKDAQGVEWWYAMLKKKSQYSSVDLIGYNPNNEVFLSYTFRDDEFHGYFGMPVGWTYEETAHITGVATSYTSTFTTWQFFTTRTTTLSTWAYTYTTIIGNTAYETVVMNFEILKEVLARLLYTFERGTQFLYDILYQIFVTPIVETREVISEPYPSLYLAARGRDDRIYVSPRPFGGWGASPTGSTPSGPAVAICGNKLHVVVRGGSNALWHRFLNLETGAWSDWKPIGGLTPSKPSLTALDGKLWLAVRGMSGAIYVRPYDCASDSWGSWVSVPGYTTHGPSVAADASRNILYLAVRGGSGGIWVGRIELPGMKWLGWEGVPGATPSGPALATSSDGTLYLAVRGMSDGIFVNRYIGSWTGWTQIPGSTIDDPTISIRYGALQLAIRGRSDAIWYSHIKLPSWTWSGWQATGMFSYSPPTLTKTDRP
jgi:hypothetical protein